MSAPKEKLQNVLVYNHCYKKPVVYQVKVRKMLPGSTKRKPEKYDRHVHYV